MKKASERSGKSKVEANGKSKKKTECPITRSFFREHAKSVPLDEIPGMPSKIPVKEFDSGTLGFFVSLKGQTITINGVECPFSGQLQLWLTGSKELPQEEEAEEEADEDEE